jgi:hypothetical protein
VLFSRIARPNLDSSVLLVPIVADSVVAAVVVVVAACPGLAMDTQAALLAAAAAAAAAAGEAAVKSMLPTFVYSGPNFHHGIPSTNPRLASIYCRLAGS